MDRKSGAREGRSLGRRVGTPAALRPCTYPGRTRADERKRWTVMERNNTGYEVLSDEAGRPIKAWTVGVPFEDEAKTQLKNLRGLPFIHKWIAVMPDVHRGF